MLLDAVLLNAGKMSKDVNPGLELMIFPEMRMSGSNTVTLRHKLHPNGMSLMGIIDYAVIQYKNELQTRGKLLIRQIKILPPCVFQSASSQPMVLNASNFPSIKRKVAFSSSRRNGWEDNLCLMYLKPLVKLLHYH